MRAAAGIPLETFNAKACKGLCHEDEMAIWNGDWAEMITWDCMCTSEDEEFGLESEGEDEENSYLGELFD
jgi:hypothetical protein